MEISKSRGCILESRDGIHVGLKWDGKLHNCALKRHAATRARIVLREGGHGPCLTVPVNTGFSFTSRRVNTVSMPTDSTIEDIVCSCGSIWPSRAVGGTIIILLIKAARI